MAISGADEKSQDVIHSLRLQNGQRRQLFFTDSIPQQLLTGAGWLLHAHGISMPPPPPGNSQMAVATPHASTPHARTDARRHEDPRVD